MNLFEQVNKKNEERARRLAEGKLNCIPIPFKRFRSVYPGFEQGKYIIVTANQKIGKSKLADFLFVYEPLMYMLDKNPELKLKILYFTLEMTAEEKMNELQCYLLGKLDRIRISTRELRSVDKIRDPRISQLLNSDRYQRYLKTFMNILEFDETNKNPTGIRKKIEKFALDNGHENYIRPPKIDSITGEKLDEGEIDPINPYTPNDPEEYKIVILDNAANISSESNKLRGNLDTPKKIIEAVSKDLIKLRNRYKFIIVLIQHQAQAQEGIENRKLGLTKPTSDGLGDCKTTSRDANCVIGLYNPVKFLKEGDSPFYKKYNIARLNKSCRFIEILEDRDYGAGGSCIGLLFDGAINTFQELPLPDNPAALEPFYRYAESIDGLIPDDSLELTNP